MLLYTLTSNIGGLASFNTREIRIHMREIGITHLIPERRHNRGSGPGELTEELSKIADSRGYSEVIGLEESWTQLNTSKWRLRWISTAWNRRRR